MELNENNEMLQLLTYKLGDEVFAVDVHHVREVLDMTPVTKVPNTPDYMLGVINLRGSVVPVIDMRLKFGMQSTEMTRDTCIVVLEVDIDGDLTIVGALADAVEEVLSLAESQIEPPPKMGMKLNTEFIRGMGKQDELFMIILEIDKVFSSDELSLVQTMTGDTEEAEANAEADT